MPPLAGSASAFRRPALPATRLSEGATEAFLAQTATLADEHVVTRKYCGPYFLLFLPFSNHFVIIHPHSDATGKMVLPTARVGADNAQQAPRIQAIQESPLANPAQSIFMDPRASAAMDPVSGMHHAKGRARTSSSATQSKSPTESPKLATSSIGGSFVSVADIPPERRRELIGIFFSQLHPFSSIVDEISFLRDLSTFEVSPALLLSMFALAARFQQGVEEHVRYAAGEQFARSARATLSEEDAHGHTALDRPDIDTAMSLCFLAAHELGMARIPRALSYSSDCVRMVAALKLHEGQIPEKRRPSYSRDPNSSTTRRNCCYRLACLAWSLDTILSGFAGQAPTVRAEELDTYLGNLVGNADDVTRSFISMARIFGVFIRVLDHTRSIRSSQQKQSSGKQVWSLMQDGIRRCEESLHDWAESLTVAQKFNEANLTATGKALADGEAQPSADMAWCWAMMHAMAEASMFVLHASNHGDNDQSRQGAAYNNLLLILEVFGHSGRRSPFVLPALLICTEFPVRPTLNVSRWWNQARECWGLSDAQIGDAVQNLNIARQASSPSLSLPLPAPSSASSALPRHHASGSGSMLPSLNSLPLPALRLSPPSSAGGSHEASSERPTLSPIGSSAQRNSPPALSSWRSSSMPGSPPSKGAANKESPNAPRSPGSTSFELYASSEMRSPPLRASATSGNSPSSDPRMAWNPLSSLRGEKRSISSMTH